MQEIIIKMHITEKGTDLQKGGAYVFLVAGDATKNEIKKAVKKRYNVDAVSVNTIKGMSRAKRYKNKMSVPKTHKKAIVTLKDGQSIALT